MDIKRIIREEVNDFGWVEEVDPWVTLDAKFNISIVDDKLIFTNTNTFEGRIRVEQELANSFDSTIYKSLNPNNASYKWYNPKELFNRQREIHQIYKWRIDRLGRFKKDYPNEYEVILSRVTGG